MLRTTVRKQSFWYVRHVCVCVTSVKHLRLTIVNNSHSNTHTHTPQTRCKKETCRDQESLFGQSNDKNENEDPRHFAMSRVIMGEHLLGSKSKKKKRQKLSNDDENRSLKWTHEIATCNADFVGEWDGEWEPCALLGKNWTDVSCCV